MQKRSITRKKVGMKTNFFRDSQTFFGIINENQFNCHPPETFNKNFECFGVGFTITNFSRNNNGIKMINESGLSKPVCCYHGVIAQEPCLVATSSQFIYKVENLLVNFVMRKFFYKFH